MSDSYTRKNKSRFVPGGKYIVSTIFTLGRLFENKDSAYVRVMGISNISNFCKKFSERRVLLVGSNPSRKSPDLSPFHKSTKSRQFADKWFEGECWAVEYTNLVDYKTEDNKQLSVTEIKENLHDIKQDISKYVELGYKVIACGKTAAKGLKMAEVDFFEMPHPSGLNRFWNSEEDREAKITEMKALALND